MDERPLVLVIRGIGDPQQLSDLRVEGCEMAFAYLPQYAESLARLCVDGFAELFDEVIARRYAGRVVVVVGVSLGAAVALSMTALEIKAVVVAEPFLRTAHLWPLIEFHRTHTLPAGGPMARLCNEVLGYWPDRVEPRVFPIRTGPIYVVTGDRPLTDDGPATPLPSLTSPSDRAELARLGAQFLSIPGGHDAPDNNPAALASMVTTALERHAAAHRQRAAPAVAVRRDPSPAPKTERPLVLVIRGIGAPRELMDMQVEGAEIAFVDLYTREAPARPSYAVEDVAKAFDALIAQTHRGRRIVLVGVSLGAAVALAMTAPEIESVLVVEPFFRTGHLWPLITYARQVLMRAHDGAPKFCAEALGYFPDRLEERAFAIRTTRPIYVLTGDRPLTADCPFWPFPSFTCPSDRKYLGEHGAKFLSVPGGHGAPVEDTRALKFAIETALKAHAPA